MLNFLRTKNRGGSAVFGLLLAALCTAVVLASTVVAGATGSEIVTREELNKANEEIGRLKKEIEELRELLREENTQKKLNDIRASIGTLASEEKKLGAIADSLNGERKKLGAIADSLADETSSFRSLIRNHKNIVYALIIALVSVIFITILRHRFPFIQFILSPRSSREGETKSGSLGGYSREDISDEIEKIIRRSGLFERSQDAIKSVEDQRAHISLVLSIVAVFFAIVGYIGFQSISEVRDKIDQKIEREVVRKVSDKVQDTIADGAKRAVKERFNIEMSNISGDIEDSITVASKRFSNSIDRKIDSSLGKELKRWNDDISRKLDSIQGKFDGQIKGQEKTFDDQLAAFRKTIDQELSVINDRDLIFVEQKIPTVSKFGLTFHARDVGNIDGGIGIADLEVFDESKYFRWRVDSYARGEPDVEFDQGDYHYTIAMKAVFDAPMIGGGKDYAVLEIIRRNLTSNNRVDLNTLHTLHMELNDAAVKAVYIAPDGLWLKREKQDRFREDDAVSIRINGKNREFLWKYQETSEKLMFGEKAVSASTWGEHKIKPSSGGCAQIRQLPQSGNGHIFAIDIEQSTNCEFTVDWCEIKSESR